MRGRGENIKFLESHKDLRRFFVDQLEKKQNAVEQNGGLWGEREKLLKIKQRE